MNASLRNLVNLETELAATRLLVEEYEAENWIELKYTVETERGSNSSVELTQIRDELTVTQAKLDSLRDHIKTHASQLLDLTSDIAESANVHTESDRGVNQGGSNCDNEGTLINQVSSNDGFRLSAGSQTWGSQ